MWWLIIIFMVVLIGVMTGKQPPRKKKKAASKRKPVLQTYKADDGVGIEIDWPSTFLEIELAIKKGDYDFARTWLQKFSYTTVDKDVPQSVRDRFKTLMTAFAKQDPLYQSLIGKIQPLVEAQPGILQTALYPHFPEFPEEQIRYVLYFAHELGDLNRLKKGRSYQVFGPTRETVIRKAEPIGNSGLTATMSITKNPIDERIAALHREATQHKGDDWNAAIACLQEASDLMRRHGGYYGFDRWTRLPVFLQQAGRFDEAMREFERLLSEVEDRVKNEGSDRSTPASIQKYIHLNYQQIYDKMRMVCKRQKLLDKAAEYQALTEKHARLYEELAVKEELARRMQ